MIRNSLAAFNRKFSVIISSSFIPSHPETGILEKTLASLAYLGEEKEIPVYLVQDALRRISQPPDAKARYGEYLERLQSIRREWPNLKIIKLKRWGHISGGLRRAVAEVKTEFVLVVQHDLPFARSIDIGKVIDVMLRSPNVKHVRFNINPKTSMNWDAEHEYGKRVEDRGFFLAQEVFGEGSSEVNMVRTLAWSDNNYLCSVRYLKGTVLALTAWHRVPPEHVLNPLGKESNHDILGTYIYGKVDEKPTILHLDGRNGGLDSPSKVAVSHDPWWHHGTKHLHDKWVRIEARIRLASIRLKLALRGR